MGGCRLNLGGMAIQGSSHSRPSAAAPRCDLSASGFQAVGGRLPVTILGRSEIVGERVLDR
jgi:hypothetical protein